MGTQPDGVDADEYNTHHGSKVKRRVKTHDAQAIHTSWTLTRATKELRQVLRRYQLQQIILSTHQHSVLLTQGAVQTADILYLVVRAEYAHFVPSGF